MGAGSEPVGTATAAHSREGPMRVLAIDDHALFRRWVAGYLREQEDVAEVWEAGDLDTALAILREYVPDVVLVDIDLGGRDGLESIAPIRALHPGCTVVVLTAATNERDMLRALQFGADGYLVKDIEPGDLIDALRGALRGQAIFQPAFLMRQLRTQLQPGVPQAPPVRLTERERDVLRLVTDGLMDKQVAERLHVSENTVKNHMKNIRRKLGAANRAQASCIGLRMGLLDS